MGKYARLGKNTGLVFIGTAGSKLLSLLMLPFYTRWLTVSDYGSVDLITTYSGLMLGIISCSIFDSIFLFPKDQPKNKQSQYLSSGILFWFTSLLLLAVICFCITILGDRYSWHGFIFEYLWYIYAVLAVSYLQSITQQFLRAIDKMIVYSTTGIVLTAAIIVLSFILIPQGGVRGYIIAIVIANIISIAYSIAAGGIWKFISIKSANKTTLGEMLKYSIPLIPNATMWFLINSLNRPILESWTGIAAVGIFAVAGGFPNLLNTVYLLFQNAWLISVIEEAKKDSYEAFYNKMLKTVIIVQTLLAVILAFCGKWIIQLFTTPEYYSAWQYIPVLVIGVIFMNVATFVGSNFAVTRESKYYFYSTAWSGLTSVILNFILIPLFGLWGACWSVIISQAICMVARIKYSWKTVKITDIKFYGLNAIFLIICVTSSILIESKPLLYITIIIMVIYFYVINKNPIKNITKLISVAYENRIKRN